MPVSGPMDAYSHRLANQVLGNDPMAAALEITLLGPELVADGDITCAVAGAEIDVTVDGTAVAAPSSRSACASGARLRCGARGSGTRHDAGRARRVRLPADARQPRHAPRQPHGTVRRPRASRRRRAAGRLAGGRGDRARSRATRSICRRGRTAARRAGRAPRALHGRCVGAAGAGAVHRQSAVQSHGLPARRPGARARRRGRHPVGGDADRRHPGAGVGPADPADGRARRRPAAMRRSPT